MEIPFPRPGFLCRVYAAVAFDKLIYGRYADQAEIYFSWFLIHSRTPKGFWIIDAGYRKRWVQEGRGRRYAYEDPALAFDSFRQRLKWRKVYHNLEARRIAAIEKELSNV